MQAVTMPLVAHRWTPYVETPVAFIGRDYSAATFAMQLRVRPDALGSPLVSLTGATAGSQGISCVVTTDDDDVPTSWITIQIDEATLEALLPYAETSGSPNRTPGSDLVLYHDIHITGGGHVKRRRAEGTFTIKAGVTQ